MHILYSLRQTLTDRLTEKTNVCIPFINILCDIIEAVKCEDNDSEEIWDLGHGET